MSELARYTDAGALLAVGTTLSAVGLLVAVAFLVTDRAQLRSTLRGIDDLYKIVDTRDQVIVQPIADRLLAPLWSALGRLGRRYSPTGRIDEIRTQLKRAGRPEVDTDRYLARRVLATVFAPVGAVGTWTLMASMGGLLRVVATGLVVASCTILPGRRLRKEVEAREQRIRRQLPDIMDLVVICMEAGLGFTSAVSRTVAHLKGEFSDELALMLGEMRAGASRADALTGLGERVQIPEIRSFVSAIRAADKFGIAVSSVLRDQGEDMRVSRRLAAQEKAMKAPVKMLIPMVFCIFPPMFIIVIGPAGISLMSMGQ